MRIDEILEDRRPVFSFEFFPPKDKQGMTQLKGALDDLAQDRPAYVSVTYGAGGSTRDKTVEVTKWIKQELGIEAMAHLSCVGEPVSRLREILDEIRSAGIENVLALRGDPPRGETEWTPHPEGRSLPAGRCRAQPRVGAGRVPSTRRRPSRSCDRCRTAP